VVVHGEFLAGVCEQRIRVSRLKNGEVEEPGSQDDQDDDQDDQAPSSSDYVFDLLREFR
jgi:hypothetical protein